MAVLFPSCVFLICIWGWIFNRKHLTDDKCLLSHAVSLIVDYKFWSAYLNIFSCMGHCRWLFLFRSIPVSLDFVHPLLRTLLRRVASKWVCLFLSSQPDIITTVRQDQYRISTRYCSILQQTDKVSGKNPASEQTMYIAITLLVHTKARERCPVDLTALYLPAGVTSLSPKP